MPHLLVRLADTREEPTKDIGLLLWGPTPQRNWDLRIRSHKLAARPTGDLGTWKLRTRFRLNSASEE